MPFFSVIIPVYNRAHRLPYVLKSLKQQTFLDFETIIVDDVSTDNSYQVAMDYELPNKIVLRNERNCERCVTRNRGIDLAKGQYICFLDSDDYHLPEHFQKLHEFIVSNGNPTAFFFTNAWNETEDGIRTDRSCPDFENYNPYTYFLRYTVNPQRWAVHRDILREVRFDPTVTIAEDMDLSLRIVEKGFPVFQLNERTTVYVAASDSFSHGAIDKAERELLCYNLIFARKELAPHLPKPEIRRLKSQCYFHQMEKAFAENRKRETIKYGILSFVLCPRGYNGKTNKIVLASCAYSLPLLGGLLSLIKRGKTL